MATRENSICHETSVAPTALWRLVQPAFLGSCGWEELGVKEVVLLAIHGV